MWGLIAGLGALAGGTAIGEGLMQKHYAEKNKAELKEELKAYIDEQLGINEQEDDDEE